MRELRNHHQVQRQLFYIVIGVKITSLCTTKWTLLSPAKWYREREVEGGWVPEEGGLPGVRSATKGTIDKPIEKANACSGRRSDEQPG